MPQAIVVNLRLVGRFNASYLLTSKLSFSSIGHLLNYKNIRKGWYIHEARVIYGYLS